MAIFLRSGTMRGSTGTAALVAEECLRQTSQCFYPATLRLFAHLCRQHVLSLKNQGDEFRGMGHTGFKGLLAGLKNAIKNRL